MPFKSPVRAAEDEDSHETSEMERSMSAGSTSEVPETVIEPVAREAEARTSTPSTELRRSNRTKQRPPYLDDYTS